MDVNVFVCNTHPEQLYPHSVVQCESCAVEDIRVVLVVM